MQRRQTNQAAAKNVSGIQLNALPRTKSAPKYDKGKRTGPMKQLSNIPFGGKKSTTQTEQGETEFEKKQSSENPSVNNENFSNAFF